MLRAVDMLGVADILDVVGMRVNAAIVRAEGARLFRALPAIQENGQGIEEAPLFDHDNNP